MGYLYLYFYSAPVGERSIVMTGCLSVCLSASNISTGPIVTNFFMLVTCCRGSVFLWRRGDILYASGFMDDVMFAHNCQTQATRKMRILKVTHVHRTWNGVPALPCFIFARFLIKTIVHNVTQNSILMIFCVVFIRYLKYTGIATW